MYNDSVESVLYRLSIGFVKENNSMVGYFSYGDLLNDIYLSSLRRHIIGDLQIFGAELVDNETEAIFQFSPVYLNREVEMLYAGVGELKWKLILPGSSIEEGVTQDNLEEVESEIFDKLSRCRVEIINFEPTDEFNLRGFIISVE